ncbi:MAG: PAS domain S-box protein [Desulfarculus sp.]|nr:PAS domain S-box protein [Desulfarculus sp.]
MLGGSWTAESGHGHGRIKSVPLLLACGLALLICLALAGTPAPAAAQANLPRVVILDSYHQGEDWSDNELAGILPTLQKAYPDLAPAIERLDAKRWPGPANLQNVKRYLAGKYQGQRLDLLMVLDNSALDLVLQNRAELFPGVPVVFAGVNGFRPEMIAGQPGITGVKENQNIAGTLELILALQPGTRRVLAVHDYTSSGISMRREAVEALALYRDRLEVTFTSDAPFAQLDQQLRGLPADAVVLILTYVTDQAGRTFTRAESTRLISQASPVPVYAAHETRLGHGILGGLLLEGREHGAQAAEMALQVLAGADPASLPVADSRAHPVFDHQVMARFNISRNSLPPGSRIINLSPSRWERHRAVLVPLSVVLLVLCSLAAWLGWALLRGRRAEAALRQSEARQRLLLETMTFGVAECDPRGTITYANPALARMQGADARQLTGQPLWDTMLPGADQESMPAYFQDLTLHQPEPQPYFTTNQRQDGSQYLARVDWSYQRDQQGKVTGFTVIIHDITEPLQAQEALRKSEEKFRQLFEHSNDAIFVHDDQGVFLDVNQRACGMLGYSRAEILAMQTKDCHPPEAQEDGRQAFRELLSQGSVYFETVFLRADASLIDVEISTNPVGGQENVYQAIVRDITGRKRAEEEKARLEGQLRQAQKMEAIGTLAGGIAHDFNNILGAILGFAEIARDDALAGKASPQDIEQILTAAERAKRLVQQILTFSRKVEPQRRPLDLNQEVRRALDLLERTLPKMIGIGLELAPDLRRVEADPGQISQVILNLAANAVQAMPEGGHLTIATANVQLHGQGCGTCGANLEGDWVMLTVRDSGQGIAPEDLPRIFDPFFTTKEVGKGTGLGLSMVHGIVKAHGGHIESQSQVGRGTGITIYLPGLGVEATEPGLEGQSPELPGGRETILLVDDEEALCAMGARLLAAAGYRVLVAQSGEEALERYWQQGRGIDLFIMDLGMPGMGGHKALKAILALDPLARVVIASGYSATDQVRAALESGAVGYVAKPFRRSDLLGTVRQALDRGPSASGPF